MTPPTTIGVEEAARILGCKPRWLTEQVRKGRFPARKISRAWRFADDDITEILRITRRDTGPKPLTSLTPTTRRRLERQHP